MIGRLGSDDGFRPDDVLGTALVLMQTVPLVFLGVAPLGVLIVISAAVVAHSALGYEMVQAGTFSSLIALYGATSRTDNRRGMLAAVDRCRRGRCLLRDQSRAVGVVAGGIDRRYLGGRLVRGNVRPDSR